VVIHKSSQTGPSLVTLSLADFLELLTGPEEERGKNDRFATSGRRELNP